MNRRRRRRAGVYSAPHIPPTLEYKERKSERGLHSLRDFLYLSLNSWKHPGFTFPNLEKNCKKARLSDKRVIDHLID